MLENPQPFKACWLLAFEYNVQQNRLITANVRTDAGDTLAIRFTYKNPPVIAIECDERRLSIPETTELLQWATNMPRLLTMLQDAAQLTHAFFKVIK